VLVSTFFTPLKTVLKKLIDGIFVIVDRYWQDMKWLDRDRADGFELGLIRSPSVIVIQK